MLCWNEAQNSPSWKSSFQLSSPIHSGGLIPRYFVKLRYTFQPSGTMMMVTSRAAPGIR